MSQSLYSAARGLMAQQQRVDTIANNIANINTPGFKSMRADFKDAMYVALKDPAGGDGDLQRGSGVLLGATFRSFKAGMLQVTENPLDLALGENQFFAVQGENSETLYTRDGSLGVSKDNYLVNGQGRYILGEGGQKIAVSGNASSIAVASDGTITFSAQKSTTGSTSTASTTTSSTAKLGIKSFKNPQGLEARGDNLYAKTGMSGEPETAKTPSVTQGAVESSNVDLPTEMTRLIRAQRALQLSSRALTTADGMDEMVTQMR